MINDFTIKEIRQYIERLSGIKYFSIKKIEDFVIRKDNKLKWFYLVHITVSIAGHVCSLVDCGLIKKESMLKNESHSLNTVVSIFIEQDLLRD